MSINHTRIPLGAVMLALALPGCGSPHDEAGPLSLRSGGSFGASSDSGTETWADAADADDGGDDHDPLLDELPFIDPLENPRVLLERLSEPTRAGENVAVHVALDPPLDPSLTDSLVRIIGREDDPVVAFKTDALVELGRLRSSPGSEFFTVFLSLDEATEVEDRLAIEGELASCDDPADARLSFAGRSPVAVTTGISFDADGFMQGSRVPMGPCPTQPRSTRARWDESLLITNLKVVEDPNRTNDVCGNGGNPNGVWTFNHLMEEMAIGSGMSTHDFVVDWLEQWLTNYTVNGDTVAARTQMINEVLQPWANASGVSIAPYWDMGGRIRLGLSGSLDLDLAPFRLSAIVNRIDLAKSSGYGASSGGELRFIFGVQNLDTCEVLPFSTIFEYGVPVSDCVGLRNWAREWIKLNRAAFAPRFSAQWRNHLQTLTESVVLHGAAPGRGNDNAINQIRTNEIALDGWGGSWELREFALTDPVFSIPISGPLQPHTVAMTPDDAVYPPWSIDIDWFVNNQVLPSVPTVGGCSSSYTVPDQLPWGAPSALKPFLGGNSLIPPSVWFANVPNSPQGTCARREFSLNTCNGCHSGETSTNFFHVDPTVSPAALSGFLTGITVSDPQFGSPSWRYKDLDRRFSDLYKKACDQCLRIRRMPDFLHSIADVADLVPIDVSDPSTLPFPVGPILDIQQVELLLGLQDDGVVFDDETSQVVAPELLRPPSPFVH